MGFGGTAIANGERESCGRGNGYSIVALLWRVGSVRCSR